MSDLRATLIASISSLAQAQLPTGERLPIGLAELAQRLFLLSSGATNAPGLAFDDLSSLGLYDTSLLTDGGLAYVLSLDALFVLDPSSSLTPDGITVIASTPSGTWNRLAIPSPRAQGQASFFLNNSTGSDESTGLDSGHPIKTQAEWARRVHGKPSVAQTLTFLASSPEDMIWNFENTSLTTLIIQAGLPAPVYSGTISAVQNWDSAPTPPLPARITSAGLPVSWTASNLLNKMGMLMTGPHAGKSFWVSADLGTKIARCSEPIESFNFDHGVFTAGDTFEIYNLVNLSGEHHFSGLGECNVIFYKLSFGVISGASHQNDITYGPFFFLDCGLDGFDFQGSSGTTCVGCRLNKGRLFDVAGVAVEAGYCEQGFDVHQGSKIALNNTYAEGGSVDVDADASVVISGPIGTWFSVAGYTLGLTFGPLARLVTSPGRLFTVSVTGTGVQFQAGAVMVYDTLPDFTGCATQLVIGGLSKTVGDLPFIAPNTAGVVFL